MHAGTGQLDWSIRLAPGAVFRLELTYQIRDDPSPAVVAAVPRSVLTAPRVASGDHRLSDLVAQSAADLDALQLADPRNPDDIFLAAGVPWYLTLFGRDSIWAARMLLPLGTELAAGTLRTLARRQGTRSDAETAEQPGKILHEIRRPLDNPLAQQDVLPPVYYGTVDATPLWISLLHDAWRWGMPTAQVAELLTPLEAALGWLAEYALNDAGFVSYQDSTGRGLANQGWKDSFDSVQFADGRLAAAAHIAVRGAGLRVRRGTPGRRPARRVRPARRRAVARMGGRARRAVPRAILGRRRRRAVTRPSRSTATGDRSTP